MTYTEIQIINLLKQGLSYTQIQDRLQVSSKTIAATKKTHSIVLEGGEDMLSTDPFPLNPCSFQDENDTAIAESIKKTNENINLTSLKQSHTMTTNENDFMNASISKIETEKQRIKLSTAKDIERFMAESEERKLELQQFRNEFRELQDEFLSSLKAESVKRKLILRTKKIVNSCEDRAFSYKEITKLYNELSILQNDCKLYCDADGLEYADSECLTILGKIEGNLVEFMQTFEADEEGEMEYSFDLALRALEEQITYRFI